MGGNTDGASQQVNDYQTFHLSIGQNQAGGGGPPGYYYGGTFSGNGESHYGGGYLHNGGYSIQSSE